LIHSSARPGAGVDELGGRRRLRPGPDGAAVFCRCADRRLSPGGRSALESGALSGRVLQVYRRMAMATAQSSAKTHAGAPARWQDYVQLLKPRVMSLVVFT